MGLLVMPFSKGLFKGNLLISDVDKLYITIKFLQQSAISSGEKKVLFFDQNSYLFNNKKEFFSSDIKLGFVEGVKGPPSNPVKLIKKEVTFNGCKIIFFPNGKISAGVVYLIDCYKNMYCLSIGVSQIPVIRKYKYDGKKWVCL